MVIVQFYLSIAAIVTMNAAMELFCLIAKQRIQLHDFNGAIADKCGCCLVGLSFWLHYFFLPHHVLPCLITGTYIMTFTLTRQIHPSLSHPFIHPSVSSLWIRFMRSLVSMFFHDMAFQLLFTSALLSEGRFARDQLAPQQLRARKNVWWDVM